VVFESSDVFGAQRLEEPEHRSPAADVDLHIRDEPERQVSRYWHCEAQLAMMHWASDAYVAEPVGLNIWQLARQVESLGAQIWMQLL
jgi:hypothetical protein